MRQAIFDKAWRKNVYTHIEHDDYRADIVSSLIETAQGTHLLVQVMHLPAEESNHSLEDWQQKTAAISDLPKGTEFDPHTGKMRVLTRSNGKVSRRVIFELITGALVIEHPSSRQKIRFNLRDLAALAIRD